MVQRQSVINAAANCDWQPIYVLMGWLEMKKAWIDTDPKLDVGL
ncbi:hypothetical protein [Metabacillus lacus]|nr:hypothetical protein [Metabacillus lacus]